MNRMEYAYEDMTALKEAFEAEMEYLSALAEEAESLLSKAKASLEAFHAKFRAIDRKELEKRRERKCYRVIDRMSGKTYLEPTKEDAERRLQEIAWANPGKRVEFRYDSEAGVYSIKERKP